MPRTTKPATPAPAAASPVTHPVLRDAATVKAVAEYVMAKHEISQLEARCVGLKDTILAGMGEHDTVVAGNHVVTRVVVAAIEPTPNMIITKAMVGQVIPGRRGKRGYTQLTVQ